MPAPGNLSPGFPVHNRPVRELVAQTAVVVFALPASALANLRAAYPAIVATLMTNLVFHFDRRCSDLLGRLHAFEDS
jgi:hypothetical protein